MQTITPQLTKELASHLGKQLVSRADPFPIDNYRQLVEHVARLAYVNRNHLLFFRGQNKDYRNKAGASTSWWLRERFALVESFQRTTDAWPCAQLVIRSTT